MTITTKQMKIEFTNKEKEIVNEFQKIIDEIFTAILKEEVDTVEINGDYLTSEEMAEIEDFVWRMI